MFYARSVSIEPAPERATLALRGSQGQADVLF